MKSKTEFFYELFGDELTYLMNEYKIAPSSIAIIFLWALIYFVVIKNHNPKKKYTIKEKMLLGLGISMTILAIVMQITVIIYV
jgi:hypothetical protein